MNREPVERLLPLNPKGKNSTFFTACCRVAITDGEARCPSCNHKVIGWDAESKGKRRRIRWNHAYTG